MNYDSIRDLRREVARLTADTREHYKHPNHSLINNLRQKERRLRIVQIQAELREMMNDEAQHTTG